MNVVDPPETVEPNWKVRDVASFLGMSVSWVYKSSEAGLLPCKRIGASLRFRPGEILHWLERHNIKPVR